MSILTKAKLVITVLVLTVLAACGGGAPGAGTPALSKSQKNFEATVVRDTYVTFDWILPTTNVAPVAGTHFFYTNKNSALTSPAFGAVLDSGSTTNLTATLTIPDQAQRYVDRVVKNGIIYVSNNNSVQMWSYLGKDILITTYATDGTTPTYLTTFDDWSGAIPLTGSIANSAEVRSFLSFIKLTTPLNFDFTQTWLTGASYFTRKGYRTEDTLFVFDWAGAGNSYDANVKAYTGAETTIEAYFASATVAATSGWLYDNVLYNLSDGSISVIQGLRTWISKNKRPTSAAPLESNIALMEMNGKLYAGVLQKSGSRVRVVDVIDSTVVHDYVIRLNAAAADSIMRAVKF